MLKMLQIFENYGKQYKVKISYIPSILSNIQFKFNYGQLLDIVKDSLHDLDEAVFCVLEQNEKRKNIKMIQKKIY